MNPITEPNPDKEYEFHLLEFKSMVDSAIKYSEKTKNILASENANKILAVGYLSQAGSLMHSAHSLYISCDDDLEATDMDKMFEQFDRFANEALTAVDKGYSDQVNVEYKKLNDIYHESSLAYVK